MCVYKYKVFFNWKQQIKKTPFKIGLKGVPL